MYCNVTLLEREKNGKPTWRLLGPGGTPIAAFEAFAESLKNSPLETRQAYCRHVAEFIDYLIEAAAQVSDAGRFTSLQLAEVVEAYREYLLFGESSGNDLARAIGRAKPPGRNAVASLSPKLAAVRKFLNLSERVRQQAAELSSAFGLPESVAPDALLPQLSTKRVASPQELKHMRASSMLAGVIAKGPRLLKSVVIPAPPDVVNYDQSRAFPFDKVLDFLEALPTYRDKALYSLYAASGCRSHEGNQVLLTADVDVVERTVRLVDPATRPHCSSYLALSPAERDELQWKGRTTDLTLLIEPFASYFFEALHSYLTKEHLPHGIHDFLFQYNTPQDIGKPYFLTEASSRLTIFHAAAKRVSVELPKGTGPHSLRHMYGTYVLNYFPRAGGEFGLPVSIVQTLLGHASAKHTLKYARYDKDLFRLETEAAQRAVFQRGAPKRLLELQFEALTAQLKKVEAALQAGG